MSANLNNPFGESCCDGGATSDHASAQPCGCDPGANYIADRCVKHNPPKPPIPYVEQWLNKAREDKINVFERHYQDVIRPSWNFSKRLVTKQLEEMNALVGLAAEGGELLDIGKKMWFHTPKPFEEWKLKIKSELGDILYYWMVAVKHFGFTFEEIIDYNREKLESRHPELGKVTERFGKDAIKG